MGLIPRNGPNFLRRLGRHWIWGNPSLYRRVGIARERGDCCDTNYDLWIDGFPRSANTFAVKSFQAVNPSARIRSHHHIPVFIIQSLRDRKPGMMLVRKPEDSVLSWAIFWNVRVADCLDYYVDFHRALLPYRSDLFMVQFEEVTSRFDAVVNRFNQKFGTNYAGIVHNPQTLSDCFAEMDRNQIEWRGFVDEMRVPRPSAQRAGPKLEIRRMLCESPALARKLKAANDMYNAFLPGQSFQPALVNAASTQELPTCS